MMTNRSTIVSSAMAVFFCVASIARAAEPVAGHRLMFLEYGKGSNRLVELDADSHVVWEHKPPSLAVIFQVLSNGNVLYAFGGNPTGVREVTRKGEEFWKYISKSAGGSSPTMAGARPRFTTRWPDTEWKCARLVRLRSRRLV